MVVWFSCFWVFIKNSCNRIITSSFVLYFVGFLQMRSGLKTWRDLYCRVVVMIVMPTRAVHPVMAFTGPSMPRATSAFKIASLAPTGAPATFSTPPSECRKEWSIRGRSGPFVGSRFKGSGGKKPAIAAGPGTLTPNRRLSSGPRAVPSRLRAQCRHTGRM